MPLYFRRFFLSILTLLSCLFAYDDAKINFLHGAWDSIDDLDSEHPFGNKPKGTYISYAGMGFICERGCAPKPWDPYLKIFSECIQYTHGLTFYERKNPDYTPWSGNSPYDCYEPWRKNYGSNSYDYRRIDWQSGIDLEDAPYVLVPLDTYDQFLKATSLYWQDLSFYHQATLQGLKKEISQQQKKLFYVTSKGVREEEPSV